MIVELFMNSRYTVSIILPATDEPLSLAETVTRIKKLLPNRMLQLIIVTHPKLTTSECREKIIELQKKYGDEVETFDQVQPGIGGAIQEAFSRAGGTYTVLMSSDLETDPDALPSMLQKLDEGYDIAATTRWKHGIRFSGYHPVKLVLNFGFQLLFRVLYWTSLTDLTYAYRAYRTPIVKEIRWEELRFPFLFETILKPLRLGYRVAEIEAPWKARTEGVSHNSWRQTFDYARVGLRVRFQSKNELLHP